MLIKYLKKTVNNLLATTYKTTSITGGTKNIQS